MQTADNLPTTPETNKPEYTLKDLSERTERFLNRLSPVSGVYKVLYNRTRTSYASPNMNGWVIERDERLTQEELAGNIHLDRMVRDLQDRTLYYRPNIHKIPKFEGNELVQANEIVFGAYGINSNDVNRAIGIWFDADCGHLVMNYGDSTLVNKASLCFVFQNGKVNDERLEETVTYTDIETGEEKTGTPEEIQALISSYFSFIEEFTADKGI